MFKKLLVALSAVSVLIGIYALFFMGQKNSLPLVAIANYGPHASLEAAITGFKNHMQAEGFIENRTVRYEIVDVGFDPSLISQMLISLKAKKPKVMLVMTTPIAQAAKGKIHDIPLVYTVITDPIEAGLIKNEDKSHGNMTGSADRQDLGAFLEFARSLVPKAKRIGLLYAPSESNDVALVSMMKKKALDFHMSVVAIPVDQARDVQTRMQAFKNKVDLIYVGTSGPIQPTLPVISAEARKMAIPVFNAESQAVKDGLALASFGVDYLAVGRNAGKLVSALLRGKDIKTLHPLYPTSQDHHGVIHQKRAKEYGITPPSHAEIVG